MWFLALMNGPTGRTVEVPLSFLGGGEYRALIARDRSEEAAALAIEDATPRRGDSLRTDLRGGGGYVARLSTHE